MTDAASVMGEVMNEFQGGAGGDASSPSPAPTPEAPVAPLAQPTAGELAGGDASAPAAGSQPADDPNWYEKLLAEQSADPLAGLLLPEEQWGQMQTAPEQLMQWATNARQYLTQVAEQEKAWKEQEPDVEWFGGRQNIGLAARIAGDLFRGGERLAPEEAREFGEEGLTYVERGLERIRQTHEGTAWQIAAGVLNRMPEIIDYNRDFVLRRIGLDPELIDSYHAVTMAGGYTLPEDTEAESQFLAQMPAHLHGVYRKLPPEVRKDLQQRNPGVAQFDLQQYAKTQEFEERQAQQQQQQLRIRAQQIEEQATSGLANATREVFQEYMARGEALGLNKLEAAGVAALAYSEMEAAYWQANSEQRRVMDDWYNRFKGGNDLQIKATASAYKKLFEQAYRKALSQYAPKRPTAAASAVSTPVSAAAKAAPVNGRQPQFSPQAPPGSSSTNPVDVMNDIMKQFGAI
jgi:hypothetical protein